MLFKSRCLRRSTDKGDYLPLNRNRNFIWFTGIKQIKKSDARPKSSILQRVISLTQMGKQLLLNARAMAATYKLHNIYFVTVCKFSFCSYFLTVDQVQYVYVYRLWENYMQI